LTEYGTWSPYVGADAVFLAVTLLAIGVLLTYLGTRSKGAVGIKRPGKTVSVFIMLIWGLSLATLLIAVATYVRELY